MFGVIDGYSLMIVVRLFLLDLLHLLCMLRICFIQARESGIRGYWIGLVDLAFNFGWQLQCKECLSYVDG